jgi:GTP-binding protein HflX
VIDASDPWAEEQMQVVEEVLAEIGIGEMPVIPVFNKMDAVPDPAAFTARARELHPEALFVSTLRMSGLEPLKQELRRRERMLRPAVTLRVPYGDGARLAALYRAGEVVSVRELAECHEVVARLPDWQVERFRQEGLEVVVPPARRESA